MRFSTALWALASPLLAGSQSAAAQRTPIDRATPSTLPESLTIAGQHSVTIRRHVRNSAMRRALEIAERADPPRDSVLAAIGSALFKLREPPTAGRLWWSSQFDGVRVPFAITDAAVAYYVALSDTLRRGGTPAGRGVRMLTSNLEYAATVERHAQFALRGVTYADVYVVRLKLGWSNFCGELCALSFEVTRTVVVDRSGTVRAIDGDGPAPMNVS